jgi:hypothetical protein
VEKFLEIFSGKEIPGYHFHANYGVEKFLEIFSGKEIPDYRFHANKYY